MEAVRQFICLSDMVGAVVSRAYGLVKFGECRKLLYGNMFPLRLKCAVWKSYVVPIVSVVLEEEYEL